MMDDNKLKIIFNGIVSIIKAINCKLRCCCSSSCVPVSDTKEDELDENIKERYKGIKGLDGDISDLL